MNSALTVVIPTLNAAATLPGCLASLQTGATLIREIIVVDGGSTDATLALAEAAGTIIITTAAGRGKQLRAGTVAANSVFLLLLHADTKLVSDWPDAVNAALANPQIARYFCFRLNSKRRAARILERIVALRCQLFALPYGDQGLLISRALLTAIGGVPDLPLMEDVALARHLGAKRLKPLPANAITSAVRYEKGGWVCRPLRNLFCLALYYCGVPPAYILKIYG